MRYFLLLILGLTLNGCASLSKEQCQQGNWWVIGYKDSVQGREMSQLEAHREACNEYGIRPDNARYQAGRQIGLTYYCANSTAWKKSEEAILSDHGDWEAIGYEHGELGRVFEPNQYLNACRQYNISMDEAAYRKGYRAGVEAFCVPEVAFRLGREDGIYNYGVCGPYEKDFLKNYIRGLDASGMELDNQIAKQNQLYTEYHAEYIAGGEKAHGLKRDLDGISGALNKLQQDKLQLYNKRSQALDAL